MAFETYGKLILSVDYCYRIPRNGITLSSRVEYVFFQSVTYDCIIIFGLDDLLFLIKSVFYNQATVQMLNLSRSLNFWKLVLTKDNTLNFVKYTVHTKMLHVKSTIINWFYILHSEWCVVPEAFSDKCNEFRLVFGAGMICSPTEVLKWSLETNSAAGRFDMRILHFMRVWQDTPCSTTRGCVLFSRQWKAWRRRLPSQLQSLTLQNCPPQTQTQACKACWVDSTLERVSLNGFGCSLTPIQILYCYETQRWTVPI